MIEYFRHESIHYLLDEMEPGRRQAFEQQLTRFPAARIALEESADLLATLRRQAVDVPFLGGTVQTEVARVLDTASDYLRSAFRWRRSEGGVSQP